MKVSMLTTRLAEAEQRIAMLTTGQAMNGNHA
jgi:hypothetical protein